MNAVLDAIAWIFDPQHWTGASGIPARVGEHLAYTGITILIAGIIAIGLGLYIGHTGRFRATSVIVTGALRALPTLGLLVYLAVAFGFGISQAIIPSVIVLVVLAIPPILAGTYSGIEAVEPKTVDAARAMGMTEWQILAKVEIPLALPLIVGGLRSGVLQVVSTATVAAYLSLGGLGRYIFDGLPVQDYTQVLVGALLVTILALVLDGVLVFVQRLVVPSGVRAIQTPASQRTASRASAQAALTPSS